MAYTVTGKSTFVGCTGTATPNAMSAMTIVGATLTVESRMIELADGAGEAVGTGRSAQTRHTLDLECVIRLTTLALAGNALIPPAPNTAVVVANFHTSPTGTYTELINASTVPWRYLGDWKLSFGEDEVKVSFSCRKWYNGTTDATTTIAGADIT